MSMHLVEGVAMVVEHGPAGISFRLDGQPFVIPPRLEAHGLTSGQLVHVLVEERSDAQPDDVLVMRWGAGDPIYFGPQLGGLYFLLGCAIFMAALQSGRLGLLAVPIVLALVHCHFLNQRGRMLTLFAKEVSTRLAVLSLARDLPATSRAPESRQDWEHPPTAQTSHE